MNNSSTLTNGKSSYITPDLTDSEINTWCNQHPACNTRLSRIILSALLKRMIDTYKETGDMCAELGLEQLSVKCKCGRKTVQRQLKRLRGLGLIKWKPRTMRACDNPDEGRAGKAKNIYFLDEIVIHNAIGQTDRSFLKSDRSSDRSNDRSRYKESIDPLSKRIQGTGDNVDNLPVDNIQTPPNQVDKKKEFNSTWRIADLLHPGRRSSEKKTEFWKYLSQFHPDDVRDAFSTHALKCKFFPSIAELTMLLNGGFTATGTMAVTSRAVKELLEHPPAVTPAQPATQRLEYDAQAAFERDMKRYGVNHG